MTASTTEVPIARHWRIPIQFKFLLLFVGFSGALGAIWRVADTTSRAVQIEVDQIRKHTYPWMVESLRLDGEVVSIDFALESAVTFPSADQVAKLKQQDQAINERFAKIEGSIAERHRPALEQVRARYRTHVEAAIGLVEHLIAAEEAGEEGVADEDEEPAKPNTGTPGEGTAKPVAKKATTPELLAIAANARADFARERRVLLDLADRDMQESLRRTDETVHAQVHDITLISAAAALGTMFLLGWTAFGVALPMRRLRDWARQVAAGHRAVAFPDLGVNDEISDLGADFRQMTKELQSFSNGLEQLVAERTADLDRRNREMRLILDTVDQGFVTVRQDGSLEQARSAAFDRWFGVPAPSVDFAGHIQPQAPRFAPLFELGWDELMAGIMPVELCLDQLPRRLQTLGDRTYELSYHEVLEGDAVDKVLVVLTDVTARLAEEQREAEQAEKIALFEQATQRRAFLAGFISDTEDRLRTISDAKCSRSVLLRELHTLKGNAALCNLHRFAKTVHELETVCTDGAERLSDEQVQRLHDQWSPLAQQGRRYLGEHANDLIVSIHDHQQHLANLRAASVPTELIEEAASWADEVIGHHFEPLAQEAARLAERLGKAAVEVELIGKRVRLPATAKWMLAQLAHLVRNAVDHGLLTPEQLVVRGGVNTLRLIAIRERESFTLGVQDNGLGIDWERVRDKALALGLPGQSQTDLVSAIFADELSTRNEVSLVSGRGVGLSAVRQACLLHGARVEVVSQPGQGTLFTLHMALGATKHSFAA